MVIDIPAEIGDAALWAIIIGFLQPIVLNFILSAKWTSRVQALAAFGFSAVVGTVTAYFTGAFDGVGITTAILLTAVVSISAYQGFWKKVVPEAKRDIGTPEAIERIESGR